MLQHEMIKRTGGVNFCDIVIFQQLAFTLEMTELQRVIIAYLTQYADDQDS